MRLAFTATLLLATRIRLYDLDRLNFRFNEFLIVWIRMFGVSEFAVRLPAAVFGIGAVRPR